MPHKTHSTLWRLLNLVFFVSTSFRFAGATNPASNPSTGFLQNQGQWPAQDLYRVDASGFSVAFMEDGLRFVSSREVESDEHESELEEGDGSEHETYEYYVWTMRFKNCKKSINLQSADVVARRTNFFLGNDPDKWVRQAPEFANLYYEEVWPGIDVHFYLQASGELKYDFILSPEADFSTIGMVYAGLEGLSVREDGQLELPHPWHPVLEAAPEAWQCEDQTPVEVRYRITGKDSYGFEVEGEVPSGETWVIDPVLQVWSTFATATSSSYKYAYDVDHDQQGRLYMTGIADATFPSTLGIYQPIYGGWVQDGFLARYSSDGTTLDYMTYFGGSSNDRVNDLVCANGNIYFCGSTSSSDFPTTNTLGSNNNLSLKPFVACISNDGTNLIYSSYLCNDCYGESRALKTVSNGEVIVAGNVNISWFYPNGFPTTQGAYSTTTQGSDMAWGCRLNSAGNSFVWSTMLGGSSNEWVEDIAVNAQEEPFIVGQTFSVDFPTTIGALYPNFSGGSRSGFVTHLNATGTALIGSTFLGWNIAAVYVDQASGDAFLGGGANPNSGVFTPTPGAWQTTFSGSQDAILARLDPLLSNMRLGTLIGGSGGESIAEIEVNQAGEFYLSGGTNSSDFPISSCQLQSGISGGIDMFMVHLDPLGTKLAAGGAAVFGGQDVEYQTFNLSLRESAAGDTLFATLTTHSPGFPVTPGAYQTTKNGNQDMPVAMKLFIPRWNLGDTLCQGDSVQVFSPPASNNPLWSTSDTSSSIWIKQPGTYWVEFDYHGCTQVDTFEVAANTLSVDLGQDSSFCAGSVGPVGLTAASGTDWLWSTGQTTASISTTGSGTYWVQATDSVTGCAARDTLIILEDPLPVISLPAGSFCEGDSILLAADPGNLYPAATYLWSNSATNAQTFFSVAGQVWVELTDSNGCTTQELTTLSQDPGPHVDLGPDLILCDANTLTLSAGTQGSGVGFLWNTGATGGTILVNQPGIYAVTVSDPQSGCSSFDTLMIDLVNIPVVVLPADTLVCDTDIFTLAPGIFDSYSWSDGSGLPQLVVTQPGEYAVTVTKAHCLDSARSRVDFGRGPVVDLGPDLARCRDVQLVLQVPELLNGTVIWSDGGVGWSRLVDQPGTYWARVSNACGIDSDTVRVQIEQGSSNFFVPNVFSPNNDGINDCYQTNGGPGSSATFQLQVFDRWGKLVYDTRNINDCWKGDFGGRPLPEGVYYGIVKLRDCLGKLVTVAETITLLR